MSDICCELRVASLAPCLRWTYKLSAWYRPFGEGKDLFGWWENEGKCLAEKI